MLRLALAVSAASAGGAQMENGEPFDREDVLALMENAPVNVFSKDTECRYRFVSKVCGLVNTGHDNTILGKTDLQIWDDQAIGRGYYEDDLRILATGCGSECLSEIPLPDGAHYYEIRKNPVMRDGRIIGIVGIIDDVTEKERMRRRLETLSFTDALTGLHNRNYLEVNGPRIFDEGKRPFSIIMSDCNFLKKTNDQLGHEYGDLLLKRVARAISQAACDGCVPVRVGGDEFMVLCPGVAADGARDIIERIGSKLKAGSDGVITLDVATGFCTVEGAEVSFEEAYHRADQDMYRNKQASRR